MKRSHLSKAVVVLLLLILLATANFFYEEQYTSQKVAAGASFSLLRAVELGLEPKQAYITLLDATRVKRLRISTPWTIGEAQENQFNFTDFDFLVDEAQKRDVQLLVVVGMKQPGWPECFMPDWAKTLPDSQRQEKTLRYIEQIVNRYKTNPTIIAWQVENEPLFKFGSCPKPDPSFLETEVQLVKKLDSRKIVITDSGELNSWVIPMQLSDVFGTTIYRSVHNPFFGYFNWGFLPPIYYNFKSGLVKSFAPQNEETIITELQAEPWFAKPIAQTTLKEQLQLFPISYLRENFDYGKKTSFRTIYLWGAEWWVYMAKEGYPQYLHSAKQLFQENP